MKKKNKNKMKLGLAFIFIKFAFGLESNLYEKSAIITIATGGYNANDLVKSLKGNGKWDKNIYIISDQCTPKIENTIQLEISSITRSSLESKKYKMKILNKTSEDYILFLDSDIKVNLPIYKFFDRIGQYDNNCDAYMPHDVHYSKKYTINSGIIFVKRNKSEMLLKQWEKLILNKNYIGEKDQPALKKLIDDKIVNICVIPDDIVYYAPDIFHKLRGFTTAIFTHYLKFKTNFNKCSY